MNIRTTLDIVVSKIPKSLLEINFSCLIQNQENPYTLSSTALTCEPDWRHSSSRKHSVFHECNISFYCSQYSMNTHSHTAVKSEKLSNPNEFTLFSVMTYTSNQICFEKDYTLRLLKGPRLLLCPLPGPL